MKVKASLITLAVVLVTTAFWLNFDEGNIGQPPIPEAFDLSEFENVTFYSEMPDTGANFKGEDCFQLAQNFAKSLTESFASPSNSNPDYAWDAHLDNINVLSREMSAQRFTCDADTLVATISDGMSNESMVQILSAPAIVERDINSVTGWKLALHNSISDLMEIETLNEN